MTPRIKLINGDQRILKWILEGDKSLAHGLNIDVPNGWKDFSEPIYKIVLEEIILYHKCG